MCLHKFDATGLSEGGICLLNLFSTDYLTNKLRGRILGTAKSFFGQAHILKSYQEPMTLKLGVVIVSQRHRLKTEQVNANGNVFRGSRIKERKYGQ